MTRRKFMMLLAGSAAALPWPLPWPLAVRGARAKSNEIKPCRRRSGRSGRYPARQRDGEPRQSAAAIALQVNDPIFKNDALETGANSSLGVTFDDETTFSLSANTRIVVSEFVYQEGGKANAALFNVALGTAAFVASLVAKTGDMKITTPTATLGIRGTTGVVDVPAAGGAGEPRIKLYPDADGYVGRIEVFNRQGGRLGALTEGASAFALRPGPGGRLEAVPFQIPPQEAARDRGVLQRLFVSHRIGRQMTIQRRGSRGGRRGGPQPNRNPRTPGRPQPRRGGRLLRR